MEVLSCPEETEPDRQVAAEPAGDQVEVAVAGWAATGLVPAPAGTAFARSAEKERPMIQGYPAVV